MHAAEAAAGNLGLQTARLTVDLFKPVPLELLQLSSVLLYRGRRLAVVEHEKVVGQVSRRDVLRGMEEMSRKRLVRKRYPDYREPA